MMEFNMDTTHFVATILQPKLMKKNFFWPNDIRPQNIISMGVGFSRPNKNPSGGMLFGGYMKVWWGVGQPPTQDRRWVGSTNRLKLTNPLEGGVFESPGGAVRAGTPVRRVDCGVKQDGG